MNERLGIVEERQADREKYARWLKPGSTWQAPPAQASKKVPVAVDVSARVAALALQIASKEKQIADLDAQIAAKERALRDLSGRLAVAQGDATISHVQHAFCDRLIEAGYQIEGRPYTFNDLMCKSNHAPHVEPRHVCIDLARRVSTPTLISIARAFGYRDHTSVKHALAQAPGYLASNPMLAEVHAKVLAAFKVPQ